MHPILIFTSPIQNRIDSDFRERFVEHRRGIILFMEMEQEQKERGREGEIKPRER